MSSANREKRQRNREARRAAEEYAQQHAVRRRITIGLVGLGLAAVVGIALVARAASDNGSSSASSTTTTTIASAKGKPCVAAKTPLPKKTPAVPVVVGPPPTALLIRDIKKGTGAVVKPGAKVSINYVLVACSTGKVVESSFKTNQPIDADLNGNIIPGWAEGIPGMRIGGLRLLGIPPDLAYGSSGQGSDIAPDETLWFVVKAVKIGTTTSTTVPGATTTNPAATPTTTTTPTTSVASTTAP